MSRQTFLASTNSSMNEMSKQTVKVKRQKLKLKLKPKAKLAECACGVCHEKLLDRDSQGHKREYIHGHYSRGRHHSDDTRKKISLSIRKGNRWKGGRTKQNGYWLILRPDHPKADKDGYVREHILKMEKKLGRYLEWYERVHHRDHNPSNNRLSNLQLTTIWEHKKLHRRDCGQICEKCSSEDIRRNGFHNSKQTFQCNTCGITWLVNKKKGIGFNQTCYNCSSEHVVRCSGVKNNKQTFRCNDCRKKWRVSLEDLKAVVPQNDHRYRKKMKIKCI